MERVFRPINTSVFKRLLELDRSRRRGRVPTIGAGPNRSREVVPQLRVLFFDFRDRVAKAPLDVDARALGRAAAPSQGSSQAEAARDFRTQSVTLGAQRLDAR